MRWAALALFSGFAFLARGAEITNAGPPMPPHWYQKVSPGVTLHCLSPVEYFRGLLGMTPEEREHVLAGKPPPERRLVLAKIAEYEAMPEEMRDERLHQTELRWRLMNLMRLPPATRQAQLKLISPLDQPMIMSTLTQWDELPAPLRHDLAGSDSLMREYLQWQSGTAGRRQESLQNLSPERQQQWLQELRRWQSLSEGQRAQWSGEFRTFFTLTDSERKNAMDALSDSERQEMEQTLRAFALLPAAQRQLCIRSFQRFASMPATEQNEFLRNAQRWEAMSAHEREVWRRLVPELPPMPPLPLDFERRMPPMPPGMVLPGGGIIGTNGDRRVAVY
jgi:hypothetical protein